MKYAIISDIHGNNHALEAVLADAKTQGVDKYLLLGDYAGNVQARAVVETIRKINPAVVIKGNGEDYFVPLIGKDFSELTSEQFKLTYWSYNSLSPQNLDYLINLPETATITDGNHTINLAHSMNLFFRRPMVEAFHSCKFRIRMMQKPFTHDDYLLHAREALLSTSGTLDEINEMPKGIYLFGHNHLQFHMEYDGRLFINPGSCGQPLDWDTRAPYTILALSDSGWHVAERRVEYDVNQVIREMDSCGFTEYTPAWSQVLKLSLQAASDYFTAFVTHVENTAREMGEPTPPVSNAAWNAAVATWNPKRA